jgi:hypothetical protein
MKKLCVRHDCRPCQRGSRDESPRACIHLRRGLTYEGGTDHWHPVYHQSVPDGGIFNPCFLNFLAARVGSVLPSGWYIQTLCDSLPIPNREPSSCIICDCLINRLKLVLITMTLQSLVQTDDKLFSQFSMAQGPEACWESSECYCANRSIPKCHCNWLTLINWSLSSPSDSPCRTQNQQTQVLESWSHRVPHSGLTR